MSRDEDYVLTHTDGGGPTNATTAAAAAVTTNAASNDESRNSTPANEEDEGMTLSEVLYSASSFHAIARPVALTMVLSALSVVFINTEETIAEGEEQLSSAYTVWETGGDGEDSDVGDDLLKSIGNSLIIVSVICLMTFGIVLLYKFRCMKILIGYMVFSSAVLLGVLGGTMVDVAIEKYRIPVDQISAYFILYNFAVVGTIAIFYQQGISPWVTQGYLIVTSVILAWQFSHFDDWTIWTLLVFLALYDLCAVLTPCGPLKALVNLMQQDGQPSMPGLLYEASLPEGVSRPQQSSSSRRGQAEPPSASSTEQPTHAHQYEENNDEQVTDAIEIERNGSQLIPAYNTAMPVTNMENRPERRTCRAPLALACLYRLPVISPLPPNVQSANGRSSDTRTALTSSNSREPLLESTSLPNQNLITSSPPSRQAETGRGVRVSADDYSPEQLRCEVELLLPRNGTKRIERSLTHNNRHPRYLIINNENGVDHVEKCLIVDKSGRVYEVVENDSDDEDESRMATSIKLGLGDFIFYSVLVAKAAMHSFATFAACMLVILFGLGATLVLLSVYHQALPALPISIFLGVIFYLLTRTIIEPWVEDLLRTPHYV